MAIISSTRDADLEREMEAEVRNLKQELARTQEALKLATKRCRDLVRDLDNRIVSHESEKNLRDQQLSKILRALLVLEARLKQEQKSIRQLLCEKDNVIRNQQLEIAKLRRYTKNYIKSKRGEEVLEEPANIDNPSLEKSSDTKNDDESCMEAGSLSKDIEDLKCEIITKLNVAEMTCALREDDRGIKKTHSFAGSDISKTSMTSSENTDASIITTTTDGSLSLISTEGFCEGESTDVSPGSTLNKSSRCTPTTVTDSENESGGGTMKLHADTISNNGTAELKSRHGAVWAKSRKLVKQAEVTSIIVRSESKDDGLDCNFVSDDEDTEPIYVNAGNNSHVKSPEFVRARLQPRSPENNNNIKDLNSLKSDEHGLEETSGNWYSDPDEDKINEDVNALLYRPNSNHNSVLECVNQILLRDMEEEESVLTMPRRFKHRGRIVRFQPAKLSDIESVGSEMERRNSEEPDKEWSNAAEEIANFKASGSSEDSNDIGTDLEEPHERDKSANAIPIVIIEPKSEEFEETAESGEVGGSQLEDNDNPPPSSPALRMEMIEEKACLQMSNKGLTIAKNLDYEDIESLPEVMSLPPRTPPALPPKPQFKNNTLILKKIPSPSFLIDETKKKQLADPVSSEHKKLLELTASAVKPIVSTSARSLNFEESNNSAKHVAGGGGSADDNSWKHRFNKVRSSFQARHSTGDARSHKKVPKVTNIVRHFEEFKIGEEPSSDRPRERGKSRERQEIEQEFDIRQNFEEFNLDECDLSDDPDRPEADGSDRLGNLAAVAPIGTSNGSNNNCSKSKDDNSDAASDTSNANGYDYFLEATGLSNKSILTPSRLLSNHKSMLKPKDIKYKNKIKSTAIFERHGIPTSNISTHTHVRHWTGPFV